MKRFALTGSPPLRLATLCAALVMLQGCATIVVPPAVQADPVPVFLLDHGRHSSLVLPTPGGGIVRYAYGDWDWYALVETGPYRGTAALLWPTQGALGRRELPGPPTAAAVRREVKVSIVHLYPIIVERDRAEGLRRRLGERFSANRATLLYNALYDLYFVHDPQRYHMTHDSNRTVADWLELLGCQIRGGPALLSNWKVQ